MNPSNSAQNAHHKHARAWQLESDEQQLAELRQLLQEQRMQLAKMQANGTAQQSLEAVQHLITLYERALRQAEEQTTFHQKTLGA